MVEQLFSWIKEKRHLYIRYDKLASSFKAMVTLACIEKYLQAGFSNIAYEAERMRARLSEQAAQRFGDALARSQ